MPRLFTAIEIPRDIGDRLALLRGGLPGARWIDRGKLSPDAPLHRRHRHGRRRRGRRRARPRPPGGLPAPPRRRRLARHPQAARDRRPDRRRRRRSPSCRPSTSASCSGSGCRPSSGNTRRTSPLPASGARTAATSPSISRSAAASSARTVRRRSLRALLVAELGRRRTLHRRGSLSAARRTRQDRVRANWGSSRGNVAVTFREGGRPRPPFRSSHASAGGRRTHGPAELALGKWAAGRRPSQGVREGSGSPSCEAGSRRSGC